MTDVESGNDTLYIPRNIGPYQIESELGAGAMGTVYKAIHTGLDRAVALKVLRPDMLQDPASVRRFLREARSIARLEHPHIVSVYDAGDVDGINYIAMKLLGGETLQALLAHTGPLPPQRVIRLGSQLASALDYAHARDVVHLDVKPANVMVEHDRATLTDFSIAQALNPGATRSATIAGTPLYMSPEQIQGLEVDSRSDLYSLGLLLYEMCLGHPPFQGQFVTVMYAHLHSPIPRLEEKLPDIPVPLATVIYRALAKDRAQRFQTAGEMLRALEACAPSDQGEADHTVLLRRSTAPPSSATVSPPLQSHRDGGTVVKTKESEASPVAQRRKGVSRKTVILAVAAVVLIALIGGVFTVLGNQTPSTGALTISSVPVGAMVKVDGKAGRSSPVTLAGLKDGEHTVSVSMPSYQVSVQKITVQGGKTTPLHVTLTSLPPSQLVTVDFDALVSSVTQDPETGRLVLGQPFTEISRRNLSSTRIWAVAQLSLKSLPSTRKAVRFTPAFSIFDPSGLESASIPSRNAVTLTRHDHTAVFNPGFRLHPKVGVLPQLGQWRVRLLIDGTTVRTLSFTVTK